VADTKTWARRIVEHGEAYFRRQSEDHRWEISAFHRDVDRTTALMRGPRWSRRLTLSDFEGRTFATPDEGADAIRQLLGV
jgi:hypothetical protein